MDRISNPSSSAPNPSLQSPQTSLNTQHVQNKPQLHQPQYLNRRIRTENEPNKVETDDEFESDLSPRLLEIGCLSSLEEVSNEVLGFFRGDVLGTARTRTAQLGFVTSFGELEDGLVYGERMQRRWWEKRLAIFEFWKRAQEP